MCSSLYVSKHINLLHILAVMAIQLLLIRSVLCLNMTNAYLHHKCYVTQGKYKPGSVYEKELTRITHKISSTSDFSKGYERNLDGEGIFVSVILQCRGDSFGPKCRSCYDTALSGLRRRCPKYKGGIIWYDQCLLEFSGIDTVYQNDYDNNFCMSNSNKVSGDKNLFKTRWSTLLDNVTSIALEKEDNDPTLLYGAGQRSFGTYTLYGMVQCTKDVGKKGCKECFSYHIVHFQDCFSDKQGGRVLGRSCNFRVEFYPFVPNSVKM
ncbi:hypothetical protein AALP_AA4G054900 [Arabis alpina]|uniref:Gnk2-homologous domain-containing protein n=1 Tax=Arabis alpina TaxID=50452 RepID=A0A087H1C7_ARAAL|nr:hypothetical protein AALP_AA4G054900 [Arabis alpina]